MSFSACSAQFQRTDFGAPVARWSEPAQPILCSIDARRRPGSARICNGPLDPATDIRKLAEATEMSSAAQRALIATRAAQAVLVLNRTEYAAALDPTPQNRAEMHKAVAAQLKNF